MELVYVNDIVKVGVYYIPGFCSCLVNGTDSYTKENANK